MMRNGQPDDAFQHHRLVDSVKMVHPPSTGPGPTTEEPRVEVLQCLLQLRKDRSQPGVAEHPDVEEGVVLPVPEAQGR